VPLIYAIRVARSVNYCYLSYTPKPPTLRASDLNDQRSAGGDGSANLRDSSMTIELHYNDGRQEFREISGTELTAPLVLLEGDNFFIKSPCDPRICVTVVKYLPYRQVRGEVLNNIEIVRSPSEEVA